MAGAAEKKQAQRNTETLSSIHKLSGIINLIVLISIFLIGRPKNGKKYYFIYSIPLMICQYIIEKIGRPKYGINADGYKILIKAGDDLQQSGLTEYMIDIIYLTLLIDILMILFGSMKVWYLLLIIPIFAIWKLKGIISMIMGMFFPSKNKGNVSPTTTDGLNGEPVKSKRQEKLEKRGNKQKVRYR